MASCCCFIKGSRFGASLFFVLSSVAGPQPEWPRIITANFLPTIRTQLHQAEAAARAHPRDPQALGDLAMTLHAYQEYDAAAQVYQRAISLDPKNFDWFYLLGVTRKTQDALEDAVASFRTALRLRPDVPAAQLRLADSLAAAAGWDNAKVTYQQILAKHPDSPQAWFGLGRVQTATENHEAAAQSYAKACQLFPPYGAAHFALAAALRKLGKPAEAAQQMALYSANVTTQPPLDDPLFQRVQDLNRSPTAHLRRGAALESAGRYAEAINEHLAALQADPNNVQVHVNLISLYGRTGDVTAAKQHFEAATRLAPGRSDAWYNYGVLLFRQKDNAAAETAYRRALEINPHYAEAHDNLGVIMEQSGRFDDAAKQFQEAIADRPDYPLARFHLGRILAHQENYAEAIPQFFRCLQPESEQTPACLYALGATYARKGDRPHAIEYLQKALEAALAHGQPLLQASIERDLKTIQQ